MSTRDLNRLIGIFIQLLQRVRLIEASAELRIHDVILDNAVECLEELRKKS